jgi:hypothetical protein
VSKLLNLLVGGDRRSIGRSNDVVKQALGDACLFDQLIDGFASDDILLRMRCADAAEKVSAVHPDWLQGHKRLLLTLAAKATQQELRWHLAQMLPRLKMTSRERRMAAAAMFKYLDDKSRIVKVFAAQALADLSQQDQELRPRVATLLRELERTGTPAMRARMRRLNAQLEAQAKTPLRKAAKRPPV